MDSLLFAGSHWRDNFQELKVVYEGSRSVVLRATALADDSAAAPSVWAVKAYKRHQLSRTEEAQARHERELANCVGPHPCVLAVDAVFEDERYIYLAQRYAEQGDLWEVARALRPDGRLPEQLAAQIMLQVVMAVCACHESGVIHRDIKPENVVMDAEGVVKLADFGLATQPHLTRTVSLVGTLEFMPPEIVTLLGTREERLAEGRDFYDESVDVWALGCLAFELLAGASPFAADSDEQLRRNIVGGAAAFSHMPASSNARAFVAACLRTNPAERPSAHELLLQPWLVAAADAIAFCPMLLGFAPALGRGRAGATSSTHALLAARSQHLAWARAQRHHAEEAAAQAAAAAAAAAAAPSRLSFSKTIRASLDWGQLLQVIEEAQVRDGDGAAAAALAEEASVQAEARRAARWSVPEMALLSRDELPAAAALAPQLSAAPAAAQGGGAHERRRASADRLQRSATALPDAGRSQRHKRREALLRSRGGLASASVSAMWSDVGRATPPPSASSAKALLTAPDRDELAQLQKLSISVAGANASSGVAHSMSSEHDEPAQRPVASTFMLLPHARVRQAALLRSATVSCAPQATKGKGTCVYTRAAPASAAAAAPSPTGAAADADGSSVVRRVGTL